jgi:hypothetical protein
VGYPPSVAAAVVIAIVAWLYPLLPEQPSVPNSEEVRA